MHPPNSLSIPALWAPIILAWATQGGWANLAKATSQPSAVGWSYNKGELHRPPDLKPGFKTATVSEAVFIGGEVTATDGRIVFNKCYFECVEITAKPGTQIVFKDSYLVICTLRGPCLFTDNTHITNYIKP